MEETTVLELRAKLKIAAEALRASEERATAGRLALEVMHEIRNPLEVLGNLNFLCAQESEQPEKVQYFMRLAEEQLETVKRIANQTLGYARQTEVPRPTDLVSVAEAALRIHLQEIEAKKVRLVKDLPEELVVDVHTGPMLQVISNVIVNALDALPSEGTLHLRLRKLRGEVQLLIADNGHGISKENSEKVFEPFFTTKGERGTGLGLALSKDIIERHRGRIRLRSSVHPGKSGTTFKISLPT
jgi:signal transduction histidine kinase